MQKTEAEAVAEIATKQARPEIVETKRGTKDVARVLLVPNGMTAVSAKKFLDEERELPERTKGIAQLAELDSFIDHVNRFKDDGSAIFADVTPSAPTLIGVFDYHTAKGPRWTDHRAEYAFPLSPEWQEWTSKSKAEMSQAAFANFVESRVTEIADPVTAFEGAKALAAKLGVDLAAPAQLMALSRGLSVQVDRKVMNAVNLATGEGQVTFAEEHRDQAGAQLKVPAAFLIEVPVFRSGAVYQLVARLRYRVRDGAIKWWYELHRADRALDDAVREAAELARAKTALPLFYGTPEENEEG